MRYEIWTHICNRSNDTRVSCISRRLDARPSHDVLFWLLSSARQDDDTTSNTRPCIVRSLWMRNLTAARIIDHAKLLPQQLRRPLFRLGLTSHPCSRMPSSLESI